MWLVLATIRQCRRYGINRLVQYRVTDTDGINTGLSCDITAVQKVWYQQVSTVPCYRYGCLITSDLKYADLQAIMYKCRIGLAAMTE